MKMETLNSRFSVKKAHETQLEMSKKLVFEDKLSAKIRFVAGVDVAYTKELSIGAVAVLDYDSLRLVEAHTAKCKTRFPYVPTLLSFKEVPPAVLSIKKLNVNPDVFLVDGHGFAHPYGCGFASHLGLIIKKPTVGVTKNRLFGELENEAGKDVAFLRHDGKIVGARVVTKRGCKPVYVSVGHMVSLDTAIKIVRHCAIRSRIPEPILKAHEVSTAEKRKIK